MKVQCAFEWGVNILLHRQRMKNVSMVKCSRHKRMFIDGENGENGDGDNQVMCGDSLKEKQH